MDVASFIIKTTQKIQQQLEALIPLNPQLEYASLFESARYSLLAPGKRLRPLLTIAVSDSYNIPNSHAIVPACSIEMLHAYSLIHDDLPCMDDDDLRRGLPTLHKVYPEWQALLTGDYLLTHAFEILSNAPHLSSEQKIALIRCLSERAGAHGMIGGQMIDILFENQPIDWPLLEKMHRGKTSALFSAALEFGGIIARASLEEISHLREAGTKAGLAFQLIDDILDVTSSEDQLGKPIGSDIKNTKSTAVTLFGKKKAREKANTLLSQAKEHLGLLSVKMPFIEAIFEKMVDREK